MKETLIKKSRCDRTRKIRSQQKQRNRQTRKRMQNEHELAFAEGFVGTESPRNGNEIGDD